MGEGERGRASRPLKIHSRQEAGPSVLTPSGLACPLPCHQGQLYWNKGYGPLFSARATSGLQTVMGILCAHRRPKRSRPSKRGSVPAAKGAVSVGCDLSPPPARSRVLSCAGAASRIGRTREPSFGGGSRPRGWRAEGRKDGGSGGSWGGFWAAGSSGTGIEGGVGGYPHRDPVPRAGGAGGCRGAD